MTLARIAAILALLFSASATCAEDAPRQSVLVVVGAPGDEEFLKKFL